MSLYHIATTKKKQEGDVATVEESGGFTLHQKTVGN